MRKAVLFALGTMTLACAPRATNPGADGQARFGAVDGSIDGARFLDSDSKKAQAAGADDSEVIAVGAGSSGDRVSSLFALPEGDCGLVIARGNETVEDVDLFVYGDDGASFGTDEAPDKTPTVLVCPPHPKRLFAMARIASGHGIVALGVQRVPPERAKGVRKALLARSVPRASKSFPKLEEQLADSRRAQGGSWREVRRSAVPLDPRVPSRVSAAIPPNRCASMLVVPSSEASHLDVSLLDSAGRIIGRASPRGRARLLTVCTKEPAEVTLEIRPQSGHGTGLLVVSESRAGDAALLTGEPWSVDLAPSGSVDDLATELSRELSAAGYGAGKTLARGTLASGRSTRLGVRVPAGCARVDVVGAQPLHGVRAEAWSKVGELFASARGTGLATLFLCGGGDAEVDLEALRAPGPYRVLSHPDPTSPEIFGKHPLAAHRLLASAIARGVARRPADFGGARALGVAATQRASLDLVVPLARCMDVTVALGGGGRGLTLALIDRATNTELERSHGAHTVALRPCALDRGRPLAVRLEVTLDAGAGEVLVGTRLLTPPQ